MARTLRPRNSQSNYSPALGDEDGNAAAGSMDEDSGSEFAPEAESKPRNSQVPDDENNQDEKEDNDEDDELISSTEPPEKTNVLTSQPSGVKSKGRSKAKAKGSAASVGKSTVSKPTTLSGTFRRQMYVLPTPSVHHRHRAVPLYSVSGRVERLVSPPALFSTPEVVLTNNFTMNATIVDRLNKSWGYNVGPGPMWELVEDRGWFKEAQGQMESERNRRPKVHENLTVQNGWKILNPEEAAMYLPTDDVITEEGNLRPPPPITCSFGPFGSQTTQVTPMFHTIKMADFIPGSSAHVLNAGAPVWGLDWCPLHPDTREECGNMHYLAVGPLSSPSHSPDVGVRVPRPSKACMQIWSLASDTSTGNDNGKGKGKVKEASGAGKMRCDMVICIDAGSAYELKWCPLPSPSAKASSESQLPGKLGLLSGTFEDGSFAIFAIPDPKEITPSDHDFAQPLYINLPEPVLRIELEETCCISLDWANSDVVAIGMTNGSVAVYDVGSALKQVDNTNALPIENLLPTHYINIHQAAVRALAWIRAPTSRSSGEPRFDEDPIILGTGGYDGLVCLTNIRSGHGSVMNRTRDVINSMAYSAYGGGPVTIDHDDAVKAYSASPKMLGRGHMLVEPQGPIWSISASDYHPQLAVGAADGTCTTTNLLRSTRRGGSVPFFAHKIYQMDYNRTTREFRMLEKFFPKETQDRGAANNPNNFKLKNNANEERGTGVWPREVGIHRVVWNSVGGLGGAGLLASATGSGLCRVDALTGRWLKEKSVKMPYGSIESIRLEDGSVADDMDIDSDESG